MKPLKVPRHLRRETATWFRQVCAEYTLESHHLRLLTATAEAWDRMVQAREMLAEDGIVTRNRFNELRPHPAVAIERDARTSFFRGLRELDLDVEPPAEAPRAPSLRSNTRGR